MALSKYTRSERAAIEAFVYLMEIRANIGWAIHKALRHGSDGGCSKSSKLWNDIHESGDAWGTAIEDAFKYKLEFDKRIAKVKRLLPVAKIKRDASKSAKPDRSLNYVTAAFQEAGLTA